MIAKSGLRRAILRKHRSHPWAASSSGWMWVSVKNTKSKEPGAESAAQLSEAGARDAATPVAAAFKNSLRSMVIRLTSLIQLRSFGGLALRPGGLGRSDRFTIVTLLAATIAKHRPFSADRHNSRKLLGVEAGVMTVEGIRPGRSLGGQT